jgi:hypothetical protein
MQLLFRPFVLPPKDRWLALIFSSIDEMRSISSCLLDADSSQHCSSHPSELMFAAPSSTNIRPTSGKSGRPFHAGQTRQSLPAHSSHRRAQGEMILERMMAQDRLCALVIGDESVQRYKCQTPDEPKRECLKFRPVTHDRNRPTAILKTRPC